jgi:hypothetical protein
MINKTPGMKQRNQVPDWLYQEIEEVDFLMGKTPQDFPDIWEDEE